MVSKGKGRASEQTPLLDAEERTADVAALEHPSSLTAEIPRVPVYSQPSVRQTLWKFHLFTAIMAILSLVLGLLLALVLLADSYAAPAWRNISKALSDSGQDGDRFWKNAMLVSEPDAVRFTGVGRRQDEMGVAHLELNMTVAMRIAVDTDFIMGFREEGVQDHPWWKKTWMALGRWSVSQLKGTTAIMDDVVIYSPDIGSSEPLVTFKPTTPIAVLLLPGLSSRDHSIPPSTLKPTSIPLTLYPTQNASLLFEFFKHSWAQGTVKVRIHGSNLTILGGTKFVDHPKLWDLRFWRSWLKFDRDDIKLNLSLPVPPFHIPSLPPSSPGTELPKFSELLALECFNVTSISLTPKASPPVHPSKSQPADHGPSGIHVEGVQHALSQHMSHESAKEKASPLPLGNVPPGDGIIISARASLAHPFSALAPKLAFGDQFQQLPFTVSLPGKTNPTLNTTTEVIQNDLIPVVEVYGLPEFNDTHIRIPLSGYVLPLPNDSTRLSDAISTFVSTHLSYKPAAISISTPLYPSLEVNALFPPPSHRIQLLRNVTIEDMSIYPGLSAAPLPVIGDGKLSSLNKGVQALEILATATVKARIVLPRGINLDVRVVHLWTDCLVFDGEIPPEEMTIHADADNPTPFNTASHAGGLLTDTDGPPLPEPLPLPTPLPARAFGRITPRTWIDATSSIVPRMPEGGDEVPEGDEDNGGTDIRVTARLVDIPLKVLPGRQGDLSRFVTKVFLSQKPVKAGIRGVVAVGAEVPGLTVPVSTESGAEGHELFLTGLPFQGNVRVGGNNFEL